MPVCQDVCLVLDDQELLRESSFWKNLRLFAYSLKEYYYGSGIDCMNVYVCSLDASASGVNAIDVEKFAVTENMFSTGFTSCRDYFALTSSSENITELSPLVFFLTGSKFKHSGEIASLKAFSKYMQAERFVVSALLTGVVEENTASSKKHCLQLSEMEGFAKSLKKNKLHKNAEKKVSYSGNSVNASKKGNNSSAEKKEKIKVPRQRLDASARKKIFGITASCIVAAAIAVTAAILVPKGLKNVFAPDYCIVNVRDGDRLIFRSGPEKGAPELLRLYDDDVLLFLKKGDVYDQVEYHGITGYVSSQYILKQKDCIYEITNPESQFEYAKALLRMSLSVDGKDGWYWMNAAANEKHLGAMWERCKKYEEEGNTSLLKAELASMMNEENSAEKQYADHLEQMSVDSIYPEASRTNMKKVVAEKRNSIKLMRSRSAKKLSELYFDEDIEFASSCYRKCIDIGGIKPDADYMYKLVYDTTLNDEDTMEWCKEAADLGNGNAAFLYAYLGYHKEYIDYSTALTYFKKAESFGCGNNTADCLLSIGLIYWNCMNSYSNAVTYFKKVYNYYSYSGSDYYNACYALGLAYEYGWGVTQNKYTALSYYEKGKSYLSDCEKAYERVYNDLYWW